MNNTSSIHPISRRLAKSLMLAGIAGVFALAGISAASAQATTGTVFGKAPAGDAVSVRSNTTGAGRTVHVDATGRYSASALPVGVYTVTLKESGEPVAKHLNVPVVVGRGVQVDFDCTTMKCGEATAKR